MKKDNRSIVVDVNNLEEYYNVFELMNTQQYRAGYDKLSSSGGGGIEIKEGLSGIRCVLSKQEFNSEYNRTTSFSEFKELVNNKKDLINNKIIMSKKEKKFKKGTVTTTKKVTMKVPKPKYKLLTEQYLLHEEGSEPYLLTYTYAIYENGEWRYTVNHHTGCIQGESYIDKHLIK